MKLEDLKQLDERNGNSVSFRINGLGYGVGIIRTIEDSPLADYTITGADGNFNFGIKAENVTAYNPGSETASELEISI